MAGHTARRACYCCVAAAILHMRSFPRLHAQRCLASERSRGTHQRTSSWQLGMLQRVQACQWFGRLNALQHPKPAAGALMRQQLAQGAASLISLKWPGRPAAAVQGGKARSLRISFAPPAGAHPCTNPKSALSCPRRAPRSCRCAAVRLCTASLHLTSTPEPPLPAPFRAARSCRCGTT